MRVMSLAMCMGVILPLTLGASGTRAEGSGPRLLTGAQMDQISAAGSIVVAGAQVNATGEQLRAFTDTSAQVQTTPLTTLKSAYASAFGLAVGQGASVETSTFAYASGSFQTSFSGSYTAGFGESLVFGRSISIAKAVDGPAL